MGGDWSGFSGLAPDAGVGPSVYNHISQSNAEIISEFYKMDHPLMDVVIDGSLLMFSGTDSLDQLDQYSSGLKQQLEDKLPDFFIKVGGALRGADPVPNALGLGAIVIGAILQLAFIAVKGSSGSGPSPMDMMHRVFAEEKASQVRDHMEEYLKRYKMYIYNNAHLLEETVRLEEQLSLQVTTLRDSILVDKQLSRRAVKHWVNGAAFHAQMLIHIARLKQGTADFQTARTAAASAADSYQKDMSKIMTQYKELVSSTIEMRQVTKCFWGAGCWYECQYSKETMIDYKYCYALSKDSVLDYMFSNMYKTSIYFDDLQNNLNVLVNQTASFRIKDLD